MVLDQTVFSVFAASAFTVEVGLATLGTMLFVGPNALEGAFSSLGALE